MELFFGIILVIIALALLSGALMWPILVWILRDDWSVRTRILHTIGCVLLFAFILSVVIPLTPGDNNAAHCGPGTRYISESHYNPATETTITDWECVAN